MTFKIRYKSSLAKPNRCFHWRDWLSAVPKGMAWKASFNLKCLTRKGRKQNRAVAGMAPRCSWDLSRIFHTVRQNRTWTLTFTTILCALRGNSDTTDTWFKKVQRKENNPGLGIRRPGFLLLDNLSFPTDLTLDKCLQCIEFHFLLLKNSSICFASHSGALEDLQIMYMETLRKYVIKKGGA